MMMATCWGTAARSEGAGLAGGMRMAKGRSPPPDLTRGKGGRESATFMRVAFISGTSIVNSTLFAAWEVRTVETAFGPVTYKAKGDHALINRHGYGFPLPPHSINYRANIRALADLGFKDIVSLNSVGSLKADIPPGSIVSCCGLRRPAAGAGDLLRHGAEGRRARDRQQPDPAPGLEARAGVHDPDRARSTCRCGGRASRPRPRSGSCSDWGDVDRDDGRATRPTSAPRSA